MKNEKKEKINQIELISRIRPKNFQSSDEFLTRKEAKDRNLILYWTGIRCSRNHKSVRYVKDGVCKSCYKEFRSGLIKSSEIDRDKSIKNEKRKKSQKNIDLSKLKPVLE